MNQDIHTHLEKLKTELSKLEPAVKHLQNADKNATDLIASLANIHKEFAKHLQSIEKSLVDANEKHQRQLTKEIQDSTRKINDSAEQLSKSNSAFEKQIKAFLAGYEELAAAATKLIEKIDKVDFPSRLDKLDATVSAINQGSQNTQTRIGDLERNLKDDLQARARELNSKIENTDKSTTAYFEKLSKEINLLKILLFVSIALSVAMIIVHFVRP